MIPRSLRIRVPAIAALAIAAIAASALGDESAAPAALPVSAPPNLVVLMIDTARADHLGYHAYERPTTPRIDALAAQSVRFMNHYSHSSRTGPAVASLFTGLHPRSHGVVNPITHFNAKGTLATDQRTLAEILRERGYRCYGVVGNFNVSRRFGFAQGFDAFDFVRPSRAPKLNRSVERLPLQDPTSPFFLYVHYMDPHSTYAAPPPFDTAFVDPGYAGPITGAHSQLDEIVAGTLVAAAPDRAHLTALYDQELRFLDEQIGHLLDHLDELGVAGETLVVLVADHGEEFWDHGSVFHGYTLYEEQLRVPFLVRDPRMAEGRAVDAITRHVDVLPTLLELLGVPAPEKPALQGRSLASHVRGDGPAPGDGPVYAQVSIKAAKTVQSYALRVGPWKWIERREPSAGEELYDLASDPGETRNLVNERPEVAERMRREIRDFESALPVARGGLVGLTREEVEAVRRIGYQN